MLVTIVGLGALGSHTALFLRGEVSLKLVDFDRVETKNTLSQFHAKSSVGRNKAQATQQLLAMLWGTKSLAIPHKLSPTNTIELLGDADLVVDATDNAPARRLIQSAGRPTVHGALAADGTFGQVRWSDFVPDDAPVGTPTCENGDHLPFIAATASYLAYAAQQYVRHQRRLAFQLTPSGVVRIA